VSNIIVGIIGSILGGWLSLLITGHMLVVGWNWTAFLVAVLDAIVLADDPELALWPSSTGKVSRLNVFSVQSIKEAFDRPGCLLEKAGASET